jgi:16S rRNA (cytidine1402-2'-O)-methyltransferase
MVLLLELSPQTSGTNAELTLADQVATLMRTQSLSEKDALKQVAKSRGIGKSEAYREFQRNQSRKR